MKISFKILEKPTSITFKNIQSCQPRYMLIFTYSVWDLLSCPRKDLLFDKGVLNQGTVHLVQGVLFIVLLTAKDCKAVTLIVHAF